MPRSHPDPAYPSTLASAGSALLPGVPSFAQLGIAGLDRNTWVGLYAQLGLIAEGGTARELAARMEDDREYWARAVQQTGITLR